MAQLTIQKLQKISNNSVYQKVTKATFQILY